MVDAGVCGGTINAAATKCTPAHSYTPRLRKTQHVPTIDIYRRARTAAIQQTFRRNRAGQGKLRVLARQQRKRARTLQLSPYIASAARYV